MPQPTAQDVHVDAILTNISIAYRQDAANYIATRVFPVVPVPKQTDKYFLFDREAWLLDQAQRRGPSEESAGGGYTVANTSYICDVFAFHKDIDDQIRAQTDSPLNADRNATQFVTQILLNKMEADFVSQFFATSIWTTDLTPSPTWDDVTSDPIDDIELGKETILKATGFMPNKLTLGYQTFRQLKHHPDIVDRMKYTSSEVITEQILARLFGVDEVLVAKAIKNTAADGATGTYDFTHGKHALLSYAPAAAALEVPSAGYTFEWTGISSGLGSTLATSRIPMPWLGNGAERIEGQIAYDNKVVSADLGYFFNGAVA
jgi:hypothetical protein